MATQHKIPFINIGHVLPQSLEEGREGGAPSSVEKIRLQNGGADHSFNSIEPTLITSQGNQ